MFSSHDLTRITEAVQWAERRTRGEIVPMVVRASARYREAAHLAGLLAMFVVLAVFLWQHSDLDRLQWGGVHPGWLMLSAAFAYVVGAALGWLPAVIRLLTAEERMAMKVRLRAEQCFYQKGLHLTRGGTGVLIYVSCLERRVEILADRAIDERVPPGTWKTVADELVVGIGSGEATAALCAAITACGAILAEHYPAPDGPNPNELHDDLRQEP